MGPDLHHSAGLVPLLGGVAVLFLDQDVITNFLRRELTEVLKKLEDFTEELFGL